VPRSTSQSFFLNYFKDLHDPRQQGKVCYPLEEILLLCLLAVVARAETITEARGRWLG
jgi:DDE_Tnp_1-associated